MSAVATRFAFGANWLRFLDHIDEDRVQVAEGSLREVLDLDELSGRSFLDAGAGSGLFSLAAARLGAGRVHSFDYDRQAVACTAQLKQRFAPHAEMWTIEPGDVTDPTYCRVLGEFDVVYCFGVVQHTGSMWQALDNLVATIAPGGLLFLSIANSQGRTSERWRQVKRLFNRLPRSLQPLFAAAVWLPFELREAARGLRQYPRLYLRTWTRRDRWMSKWHDIVDWVGGYPFEVATPEEVLDRCREHGLEPVSVSTVGDSLACNAFVFERSGRSAPCAD
jgi:2-polyprenyl-3-methyl-5-hydroxy-6-metoxy-1,4-benzoquinol methylase